MELRKAVGLDEMAPTAQKYKDQLEQVQTIFRTTGYDAMIDFDWDTMKLKETDKGEKK